MKRDLHLYATWMLIIFFIGGSHLLREDAFASLNANGGSAARSAFHSAASNGVGRLRVSPPNAIL
jgi:hypothetical protein